MGVMVRKGSASQAEYYKQPDPMFDADDNKWQGKGLDAVGLEDGQTIEYDDFKALYAGIHPLSSENAGEPTIPLGGYDSHGEAEGEAGYHKPGYELLISPDKSVSCGFALDLPGVAEAFTDACDVTVSMAEELATARRKTDGIESEEPTGNLIVANFNHSVTRETDISSAGEEVNLVPDVNLHRHAFVMNATVREDDDGSEKLVSLKSTPFFENQGTTDASILNQAFNSQLAANLQNEGYAVDADDNGNVKLLGIPQEMELLHSKRSQAISERAEELKENGFTSISDNDLKQIANFDTRLGKSHMSGEEIKSSWDGQLENIGLSKEGITQVVVDAGKAQDNDKSNDFPVSAHDHIKYAAHVLSEEQSNFSKRDVLSEAMQNSFGDFGYRELNNAFNDLAKSKELVMLDKDSSVKSIDAEYTTKEINSKQKDTLDILNSGYVEPAMTSKEAQQALYSHIKDQQSENPDYQMSQAEYDIAHKILTSTSPNVFLHSANEMEQQKALDIVQSVMASNTSSGTPATEQQHDSAVESIKRDLSRDAAINKLDRDNSNSPDYETILGQETVDKIRQNSLNESVGSFKKAIERNVAEHIVAGTEDAEIFKATGASGKVIDNVREKLFEDASYRASKAAEEEMDKKTSAEKEKFYENIGAAGKAREFKRGEYLTAEESIQAAYQVKHETSATFKQNDIFQIAGDLNGGIHSPDEMKNAWSNLKQQGDLVYLKTSKAGDEIYSSAGMIDAEHNNIDRINNLKGTYSPNTTTKEVSEYLDKWQEDNHGLSKGQQNAIKQELLGSHGYSIVNGDPGVGKTTFAKVVEGFNTDVLEPSGRGFHTIGVAFTGQAAKEIGDVTGKDSFTIDSFLKKGIEVVSRDEYNKVTLEKSANPEAANNVIHIPNDANVLLKVDEFSFVGTKHNQQMLDKMDEIQGKLNGAGNGRSIKFEGGGDIKQMQAISSGRVMQDALDFTSADVVGIKEINRQKDKDLLDIAKMLNPDGIQERRTGAVDALHKLQEMGAVSEIKDKHGVIDATVDKYFATVGKEHTYTDARTGKEKTAELNDIAIITPLNADRKILNDRIHEERISRGEIESGRDITILSPTGISAEKAVQASSYKEGQKVQFVGLQLSEAKSLGVDEGTFGTVSKTNDTRNTITLDITGETGTISKTFDVSKIHNKVSVYQEETRNISVGDKIVCLQNNSELGVKNGTRLEATDWDKDGNLIAKNADGKVVAFGNYNNYDHAYALTPQKSQGATLDAAIGAVFLKHNGIDNTAQGLSQMLGTEVNNAQHDHFNTSMAEHEKDWQKKVKLGDHNATLSIAIADVSRDAEQPQFSKVIKVDFDNGYEVANDSKFRSSMKEAGMWFNSQGKSWQTAITNVKAADDVFGDTHPLNDPQFKSATIKDLEQYSSAKSATKSVVHGDTIDAKDVAAVSDEKFARTTNNAFNVVNTRARYKTEWITNDVEQLEKQVQNIEDKTSTVGLNGRAKLHEAVNEHKENQLDKQYESAKVRLDSKGKKELDDIVDAAKVEFEQTKGQSHNDTWKQRKRDVERDYIDNKAFGEKETPRQEWQKQQEYKNTGAGWGKSDSKFESRSNTYSESRGYDGTRKTADNATRSVLDVDGGKEELLYRDRQEKGHEIKKDKRFRVGMLTYSVKSFTADEKALRSEVETRNEEIRARKLEDAKKGILNSEKYLEENKPGWNIAVGGNRHSTSFTGAHVTKTNQKVWFGADKGNSFKSQRTEKHGSYTQKLKTYNAKTGITRTEKSSGSKVSIGGWTLYETKKAKIKEVGRDGKTTHSTMKTTTFMGSITTKKITKNHDGTITTTTTKGYEKTDWLGKKSIVITGKTSETKLAKPSLFTTLAMSIIGGKNQALTDYASRAVSRGKLTEISQEGKFAGSKNKFNSVSKIAEMAATSDYGKTSVMTYSRGRANDINQAVHNNLVAKGILQKGAQVEVYHAEHAKGTIGARTIELSVGDKVRLTDTNKNLNIKAGETGIFQGIDKFGNINIKLDKPRVDRAYPGRKPVTEIFVNARDYKAIDYNYAQTSGERMTTGKLIVDYHTQTATKDFLAGVHESISKHGGDVRIVTDKSGLAQTQIKQYDELKDKYKQMMDAEKNSSGLIGKIGVIASKAGGTKFTITNAEIVDYNHDKNTVEMKHKDAQGVYVNRTYSADRVQVDFEKLKLPESKVKDNEMFKDTVFARMPFINNSLGKSSPDNSSPGKGDFEAKTSKSGQQQESSKNTGNDKGTGQQQESSNKSGSDKGTGQQQETKGAGKSDVKPGNDKESGGITIVSAETRILSQAQGAKEMAKMEKDTRSDRFSVINADRLPPQSLNELVKENERQGNRSIIIGDAKSALGKSPEQLQVSGKDKNIADMSKQPDIQNSKNELVSQLAIETAKKTTDKAFGKLEASGNLVQVDEKEALIKLAMQEFSGKIELGQTKIMADKFQDRITLFKIIRDELANQQELKGKQEQPGKIDTVVNISSKNGQQQKSFMMDVAEQGVGAAVATAMVSAIKGGKDVKVFSTDAASFKEQVFQVLAKSGDFQKHDVKAIEVPKERQADIGKSQQISEQTQIQQPQKQQQVQKQREQGMEIGG